MRIAFTIIYNGLSHLKHNDFALKMCRMFDYWFVVDGAASNNGSTSWCKNINTNPVSTDGTIEYLNSLSVTNPNLFMLFSDRKWSSKDAMVNCAIENIRMLTKECFLWQVDCDEQWTLQQIESSETQLRKQHAKTGSAYCNQYVGENLIATGKDWGGNLFIRLWDWHGELFKTHEPPMLVGGNGKQIVLTEKFNHYSYYFKEDVAFKEKYYNYPGLLDRWMKLNSGEIKIPCSINALIPNQYFSNGDSKIVRA